MSDAKTTKELTQAQQMQKLMQKISDVVNDSKPVKKSGENDFHHYKYATHADIIQELRALIVKKKLSIIPSVVERLKEGEFTTVKMEFTITDLETGFTIASTFFGDGQDKGDKGLYKAYTGALKYFLLDTFMIETGDDPEKTSPEARVQQNRPQQAAKPVYKPQPMQPNQRTKILELCESRGKTLDDLEAYVLKAFKKTGWETMNTAEANMTIKNLAAVAIPTPAVATSQNENLDMDEIDKGIEQQKLEKEGGKNNGAVGTTTEPK